MSLGTAKQRRGRIHFVEALNFPPSHTAISPEMQTMSVPSQDEPTVRDLNSWFFFRARLLLPDGAPEPPPDPTSFVGDGFNGNEDEEDEAPTDGDGVDATKVVDVADFVGVGEAATLVFLRRPVGRKVKVIVVTISNSSLSSSSCSGNALGFNGLPEFAEDAGNGEDFAGFSFARVFGGGSRLTKSKSWSGMLAVASAGCGLDSSPDSEVKPSKTTPWVVIIVYTTGEGWFEVSMCRRTRRFPRLFMMLAHIL